MTASTLLFFVLGGVLLVAGAESLVRGASRLAAAAGISPLVIGLTVVAFGTSAPELAVTVEAAHAGQADVAVGNVVGSNIFNVLLILGIAALITPLTVAQRLVRLDVPIMIGASLLVVVLALDGSLGRLDGTVLAGGIVLYTAFLILEGRREGVLTTTDVEPALEASASGRPSRLLDLGRVGIGLAALVLGAGWLVDGAVATASALGVSELVIGLTIVAAGTSLPEVATSIVASLRGERDIAVGNVVGSNIFNLLAVLGFGSLVAPDGVPVAPGVLTFDLPVMVAVALATLPIFFTDFTIARWEGGLFLGYYVAYTTFLVLSATGHQALGTLQAAMLYFVLPLTAVTLAVSVRRAVSRPGAPPSADRPS